MPNEEPRSSVTSSEVSPKEPRGRLKVYVGAGIGVGKTYHMLEQAQQLRTEGYDVVLAFIETHGRTGTAALLGDLPIIPLREISHRGVVLKEMDVDAVLARRPQFAIVDELAHSNAPGSRHPKRYQDVEKLLEAGINVITAVNIQHIQSLSPIVKRFTGVTVTETIPESLLARAEEIVDVDVSTDELLQRVREGKIYPIEQVNLALRNFFRPSNLAILRELTLREVARDIGRQREENDLLNEWRAPQRSVGARVLVCLPSDQHAVEGLLCKGWREAGHLDAVWYAVHIQTPEESLRKISTADFRALLENVNLASDLGAELEWLNSKDVVKTIIEFAHEKRISKVILRRSRISALAALFRRSIPERLFYEARDLDVEVVSDES